MVLRYYLEHGATKSALARQFGVSRDTIHRCIRDGDLDRDLDEMPVRYGPRPAVPTKLDAYKPIIEARLAAYPELSAVRLLDEIRAAGYSGGYTQLKAFVHRVRPTPAPEPVIRCEKEDYARSLAVLRLSAGAVMVADDIRSRRLTEYVQAVRRYPGVESITLPIGKGWS